MSTRVLMSLLSLFVVTAGPLSCGDGDEPTPEPDAEPMADADVGLDDVAPSPDVGDVARDAEVPPPDADVSPRDTDQPPEDTADETGVDITDAVETGPDVADADQPRSLPGIIGIFMAIGNPELVLDAGEDMQEARRLIRQSAEWVSPEEEPSVLYLRSFRAQPEEPQNPDDPVNVDQATVTETLQNAFEDVDVEVAPEADEFSSEFVEGYDVVWYANPYNVYHQHRTVEVLEDFYRAGGGLVLQGQHVASYSVISSGFRSLLRLEQPGIERRPCGREISRPLGNTYTVQFTDEPYSALDGLRDVSFQYAGPITSTERTFTGENVLANANFRVEDVFGEDCVYEIPAVVLVDPREVTE